MSDLPLHTDRIRQFVLEQFPLARQGELQDDDSLINGQIIDSLGTIDLVEFLESTFGITLSDEELVADNFESIRSIAELVASKLSHLQSVQTDK